ncbi:hypothetical protein PPEP_a2136 [Pseudoalteromonas peptidolytica F12-50-A1]|uniref:Uncharacterized protein n=1 Tax=Pseudoalteromonas peptidolytica F12-50-A1 TaxID=1315280 RepID=A0A8I0MYL9_9GAMM|nr:hypothetical protein [Pseudoalteromonas peptidolytica F12-50-A1]NLR17048.1 hypothetical protein [Pseudoalteromonas peptidolytica]
MSITRQKFCYLVVLNEKFLTLLASDLFLQIEQVLSQIGIIPGSLNQQTYCCACDIAFGTMR